MQPFQQARYVPPDQWKTIIDAWKGYQNIIIRVASQGFYALGDASNIRYDQLIEDISRRCVDDAMQWFDG